MIVTLEQLRQIDKKQLTGHNVKLLKHVTIITENQGGRAEFHPEILAKIGVISNE